MVMSQAKQYFTDFSLDENAILSKEFIESLCQVHSSVKDYLSYVIMDFMLVDPTLEEIPTGWGFQFAEDAQLKETFDAIIKKEMKFSEKQLLQYKKKMLAAYYEVKENEREQIYE